MSPTLRQLEYLVAIAEEGSFHAAARATHVSQPGLSAQVAQLEDSLGVLLFERDRRRVLITTVGQQLAERARRVLVEVDDLVDAAHAFGGALSGDLRLGVIPTVAPYLLPKVMPRVRDRFPDLTLFLHEEKTDELLAALHRGDLDLALIALESGPERVATLPLFEDEFVVALPPDHRLAGRKGVSEADLAGESVLLLDEGHCLRDQALDICGATRSPEDDHYRASSLATLVQVVASGVGVTLLPELAVPIEAVAAGLTTVRFRKSSPHRTIGLCWRTTSDRGAAFAEVGEEIVQAAGTVRKRS